VQARTERRLARIDLRIEQYGVDPRRRIVVDESEVAQLQRCRAQRQHFGTRAVGIPAQVDQDVDAIGADRARDRRARLVLAIAEGIEPRRDRIGGGVAMTPQRVAVDLEGRAIVRAEQVAYQSADCVFAEIR
jgi:hypothetical protein